MRAQVKRIIRATRPRPVCNLCGKRFDRKDVRQNFTIKSVVGPGSDYEGSRVIMRMCCDCFDRILEGCEVSPIEQENPRDPFRPETW